MSDLWTAVERARAVGAEAPTVGDLRRRIQRRRRRQLVMLAVPVATIALALVAALPGDDGGTSVIADGRRVVGKGVEVPLQATTRPVRVDEIQFPSPDLIDEDTIAVVGQVGETTLVQFRLLDETTCHTLLGGGPTSCRDSQHGERPSTSVLGDGPLLWDNVPEQAALVQLTTDDVQQWQRPRRGYALLPGSGAESWWLRGFRIEALDAKGEVLASEEYDVDKITYVYREDGELKVEVDPDDPADEEQVSPERPYAQGSKDEPRGDHWHVAYGVYACDQYLPFLEDPGRDPDGIHTHGDGVIHVHPFTRAVAGQNAKLSVFERLVGIGFDEDRIRYDGHDFETGDDCNGEPGEVRFLVNGQERAGDPSNYRFRDCDVVVVAFAPSGSVIPPLPWAETLTNLSDVPGPTCQAATSEGGP